MKQTSKMRVALGYGELDAYGFHTLEALQCMIERRKGGETGIRSVEWIEGDAVWQWRDGAGKWSIPLLNAALVSIPIFQIRPIGGQREEARCLPPGISGRDASGSLHARRARQRLEFCSAIKGRSRTCRHVFEQGDAPGSRPFPHFDALVHCMEEMFITGKPLYPVERTLLTTCALSMLFESRAWKRRIETSELKISYRAPRDTYFQRV